MNGETMRTLSLGMPSVVAMSSWAQPTIWFDVQTVTLSPDHTAIDACGSIMQWDWSGVV